MYIYTLGMQIYTIIPDSYKSLSFFFYFYVPDHVGSGTLQAGRSDPLMSHKSL